MRVEKILHTADLHLGAKNVKLPLIKQKQLLQEHIDSLSTLFQEDSDVMLVCGDLFHTNFVTQKIKKAFFKEVEKFGRPVLYINGNHDEKMEFEFAPSNFIVLDEKNNVFRTENVDFWSACEEYQNFDYSKKNVLLLHGEISNKSDYDFVDLKKYVTKPFDYIALGHEHSFWKGTFQKSLICYSGALFANGFDECGEKGFVLVDVKDEVKAEFKPLPQRQFKMVEFALTPGQANLSNELKKVIEENKNNLLRLVFIGYYAEGEKPDFASIIRGANAFYVEFVDKTKVEIDIERYKNEPLSFKAEFIRLVEEAELGEEEKNKILTIGIEALKGDDLSL